MMLHPMVLLVLSGGMIPCLSFSTSRPYAVTVHNKVLLNTKPFRHPSSRGHHCWTVSACCSKHEETKEDRTLSTLLSERSTWLLSLSLVSPSAQMFRSVVGIAIASSLAKSGHKKKSLNKSGAIAAFLVAATAFACSIRSGMTLILFYFTGSKFTKVGCIQKQQYVAEEEKSGRGVQQVLACSLVAVLVSIYRRIWVGVDGPLSLKVLDCLGNRLTLAYVAFFACCAGDTWASEIGVLSKSPPRMITQPWKTAKPGTNGGVSLLGTMASAAGGACMGLCHALCLPYQNKVQEIRVLTGVGLLAGLLGSLVDSLLGATIQATYYDPETKRVVKKKNDYPSKVDRLSGLPWLSNEGVNLVSSTLMTMLAFHFSKVLLSCFLSRD